MTRIEPTLTFSPPPSLPPSTGFSAALRAAGDGTFPLPRSTPGFAAPPDPAGLGDRDALAATRALQAESASLNAQYLQLQEALQRENREFTTLSNVMKVKHDTARATIGNIH